MKLNSKQLLSIILLLIAGLYSFVIFIFTKTFTPCFWVNYCFVLLPFLLGLVLIFRKGAQEDSLAFNFVYFRYVIIYALIELVLGTILMYTNMTLKYVFLIQILILVVMIILMISFSVPKTQINKNISVQKAKVNYLNLVRVKLTTIKNSSSNLEVQKQLDKIISEVQYSDYNSVPEVQPIEEEILALIEEIKYADSEIQLIQIKRLSTLLKERNQTILLLKR